MFPVDFDIFSQQPRRLGLRSRGQTSTCECRESKSNRIDTFESRWVIKLSPTKMKLSPRRQQPCYHDLRHTNCREWMKKHRRDLISFIWFYHFLSITCDDLWEINSSLLFVQRRRCDMTRRRRFHIKYSFLIWELTKEHSYRVCSSLAVFAPSQLTLLFLIAHSIFVFRGRNIHKLCRVAYLWPMLPIATCHASTVPTSIFGSY